MSDEKTGDVREKLAQDFADELEEMAQKAAAGEAQPMNTRRVSDARALRDYGLRDPDVDPAALFNALQHGLGPEHLDPGNPKSLRIIRERPDLAKFYGKPATSPEAADKLVRMAEYPYRYGLIMGIDDPDERVRYSDHLDGLWQAQHPNLDQPIAMGQGAGGVPAMTTPQNPAENNITPQPAPPTPGPSPLPDPRMMMGG